MNKALDEIAVRGVYSQTTSMKFSPAYKQILCIRAIQGSCHDPAVKYGASHKG